MLGLQRFKLIVTKDLFPVWGGLLDEGMGLNLVIAMKENSLQSYFRMAGRTVRFS